MSSSKQKSPDNCLEGLDMSLNQFLGIFNFNDSDEQSRAKSTIFLPLRVLGSIVLLACIIPALPFIIVIACALSTIKYVVLKSRFF